MTLGSRLWRAGAAIYLFVNVAGFGWAFAEEEIEHAMVHLAFLVVGFAAYVMWRLASERRQNTLPNSQQADARIEYLQQSVDAIALEVERIGEAQRFSDRLRVERGEDAPLKRSNDA